MARGQSTYFRGLEIILGYGMIGMGGMGVFLSSFQVINLYQQQGLPCSIMSSMFNISGKFSNPLLNFVFYQGYLYIYI